MSRYGNILFISDPHFHNHKAFSSMVNGVNSRFVDIENAFKKAVEIGLERDCKTLVITGDIFHVRGNLRPSIISRIFQIVQATIKKGMKVVILPGNHDMENFGAGATAVDTLEWIDGCYVIGAPGSYAHLNVNGWSFLGIPYIHNPEHFKKVTAKAVDEYPEHDILLIHQGIDEFDTTGVISSDLTVGYLKDLSLGWTFSGHYHTPMNNGRVTMVGAPLQHHFGDQDMQRGCWVFDGTKAEFIPIDGMPTFHTVSCAADLSKIQVNGNFIRIKVKTSRTAKSLADEAASKGAAGVSIILEREFKPAHEKVIKIDGATPSKMLSDYMDLFPEKYDAASKADILNVYERLCTTK